MSLTQINQNDFSDLQWYVDKSNYVSIKCSEERTLTFGLSNMVDETYYPPVFQIDDDAVFNSFLDSLKQQGTIIHANCDEDDEDEQPLMYYIFHERLVNLTKVDPEDEEDFCYSLELHFADLAIETLRFNSQKERNKAATSILKDKNKTSLIDQLKQNFNQDQKSDNRVLNAAKEFKDLWVQAVTRASKNKEESAIVLCVSLLEKHSCDILNEKELKDTVKLIKAEMKASGIKFKLKSLDSHGIRISGPTDYFELWGWAE